MRPLCTRRPPRQDWGLLPGRGSCHGNPTTPETFVPPSALSLFRGPPPAAFLFPALSFHPSSRCTLSFAPLSAYVARLAQAPTAAEGKVAEARGLHSWKSYDLCLGCSAPGYLLRFFLGSSSTFFPLTSFFLSFLCHFGNCAMPFHSVP